MSGRKRVVGNKSDDKSQSTQGTGEKKKICKTPSTVHSSKVYLGLVVAAITFLTTYLYIFKETDEFETFVHVIEEVKRSYIEVKCSNDYKSEEFFECKPKKCARVVSDDIVGEEDAVHLLSIAQKGLALGGSSGGASILDLHSGALSQGNAFVNIYKLIENEGIDILSKEDFNIYKKVKNQIKAAICKEFSIPEDKLYLTKPTFFSRMNMTPPKTIHDEYWHPHVDKVTYGSFYYTSLLYLSNYGTDFSGGRFIFLDPESNKTVEPRMGRVSFFTSGSENLHRVERLKHGVRYAITVSFTCDPKQAISDPSFI